MVGVGVVIGSRFLWRIMVYIYRDIDGGYPNVLMFLHIFAHSFVVLFIAEKALGGGGGATYNMICFIEKIE